MLQSGVAFSVIALCIGRERATRCREAAGPNARNCFSQQANDT